MSLEPIQVSSLRGDTQPEAAFQCGVAINVSSQFEQDADVAGIVFELLDEAARHLHGRVRGSDDDRIKDLNVSVDGPGGGHVGERGLT